MMYVMRVCVCVCAQQVDDTRVYMKVNAPPHFWLNKQYVYVSSVIERLK